MDCIEKVALCDGRMTSTDQRVAEQFVKLGKRSEEANRRAADQVALVIQQAAAATDAFDQRGEKVRGEVLGETKALFQEFAMKIKHSLRVIIMPPIFHCAYLPR